MILFLVFIFGLVIGSFLNACIFCLPRNQSIKSFFSRCASCGRELTGNNIIPVLNRLLFRGKCCYCSEKIHWRYPATGFANALAWVLITRQWGLTPAGAAGLFLFSLSLVIAQIDFEHYLIPNSLVVLCLTGGAAYHFLVRDIGFRVRLLGMAAGFLVPLLLALISRGGMGGGDVKLMAAIGFWLGFPDVLYALFAGALLGSVVGAALIAGGKKKRKEPIPFGPFLVLGLLVIFFGGGAFLTKSS